MIRPCLGLLLALMLALTGQSMAVARGAATAAGELVLCTGQGAVSVPVDERGQPVGPPHICPDCALSLFVMQADAPQLVLRAAARRLWLSPGSVRQVALQAPVARRARGPPGPIRA